MKRVLHTSILVNVFLFGSVTWLLFRNQKPALSGPVSGPDVIDHGGSVQADAGSPEIQPFKWSQLESADYRKYIANLRSVGCPEQTIRDLITADVAGLYAEKFRQLNDLQIQGQMNAAAMRANQLRREQAAILAALLGPKSDDSHSAIAIGTAVPVREAGAGIATSGRDSTVPSASSMTGESGMREPAGTGAADVSDLSTGDAGRFAGNNFFGEKPVAIPLVFTDVAMANSVNDQPAGEQWSAAMKQLKQQFGSSVGDTSDPSSPDYRQRWQDAQERADQQFRSQFGWAAYNQWGLRNRREQLLNGQSIAP